MYNNADLINQIRKRITETVDPEQVILFGSYAKAQANEKSDIDLFIITDSSTSQIKEIKRRIRREIRDIIIDNQIDVDIFADSMERFQYRINIVKDQFYLGIKNNGKLIYAK